MNDKQEQTGDDVFLEQRKMQADGYGRFSIYVWIGSGVYLFYVDNSLSFLSWQALLFFVPGIFLVSGIVGGLFFVIGTGLAKVYAKFVNVWDTSIGSLVLVYGTALVLRVAQLVVTFIAAKVTVSLL